VLANAVSSPPGVSGAEPWTASDRTARGQAVGSTRSSSAVGYAPATAASIARASWRGARILHCAGPPSTTMARVMRGQPRRQAAYERVVTAELVRIEITPPTHGAAHASATLDLIRALHPRHRRGVSPWAVGWPPSELRAIWRDGALAWQLELPSQLAHAAEAARPKYARPAVGRLTSGFGARWGRLHAGIDIAAPLGTPVRAIAAGEVTFAGEIGDGAVVVEITHAPGVTSAYAHLEPGPPVAEGDFVVAGELVGSIGLTGITTGAHLHLAVWSAGEPLDPLTVLPPIPQEVTHGR